MIIVLYSTEKARSAKFAKMAIIPCYYSVIISSKKTIKHNTFEYYTAWYQEKKAGMQIEVVEIPVEAECEEGHRYF